LRQLRASAFETVTKWSEHTDLALPCPIQRTVATNSPRANISIAAMRENQVPLAAKETITHVTNVACDLRHPRTVSMRGDAREHRSFAP
jgi:hypothetical protein